MNGRRKLPRPHVAVLSVLFAICVSTTADAAKKHSGTKSQQKACTPDVFRLCASYIPFEGPIVACLLKNKRRLSPACRAVFQ